MVREERGPYSDPQHPYFYEEEDVWMAPGFINQFYEVCVCFCFFFLFFFGKIKETNIFLLFFLFIFVSGVSGILRKQTTGAFLCRFLIIGKHTCMRLIKKEGCG